MSDSVTMSLIHSIPNFMLICVVLYLSKREEEVQKEAQERRKLEEELKEQRGLIDALTAETMTLREEVVTLQVRQSLPHGLRQVYCFHSNSTDENVFIFVWFLSGSAAAADSRAGAEVGHSRFVNGRPWITGGTH